MNIITELLLYQGWVVCLVVAWSMIAVYNQRRKFSRAFKIAYAFAVSTLAHYFIWRLTGGQGYDFTIGRSISDVCYDALGALGIVAIVAIIRKDRL